MINDDCNKEVLFQLCFISRIILDAPSATPLKKGIKCESNKVVKPHNEFAADLDITGFIGFVGFTGFIVLCLWF